METCSLFKADRIHQQLLRLEKRFPGCAVDVTGGTDAALFAAGMFCRDTGAPAFTYSRKSNRFYDISNAPFADDVPCDTVYRVEDFFRMTGGTLQQGRVDNSLLSRYMLLYHPLFRVFLKHRKGWSAQVNWFQRISQPRDGEISLRISGDTEQKGEHGSRVSADPDLLRELNSLGLLRDLSLREDTVSFTFADEQVRAWLRDVGSALELETYRACLDAGIFDDVISSAIVNWDDARGGERVSNEIDVMATRGVIPLFISCKATEVKTEALNELAILRDRFGGKVAKAAIVTTSPVHAATRHRAAQLQIAVIDLEELQAGTVPQRLRTIMKVPEAIPSDR